jgi:hypothetical protein
MKGNAMELTGHLMDMDIIIMDMDMDMEGGDDT